MAVQIYILTNTRRVPFCPYALQHLLYKTHLIKASESSSSYSYYTISIMLLMLWVPVIFHEIARLFSSDQVVLEPSANAGDVRDMSLIPGLGRSPRRSPGRGHGNPLQYSCLENSMDRGAWWVTDHRSQRVRHDWSDLASKHNRGERELNYSWSKTLNEYSLLLCMNVNNVLSYFIIRMKKYPFSKSMAVYHVSETLLNRSSNGAPSGRAAGASTWLSL